MDQRVASPKSVSSVQRALDILESVTRAPGEIGLRELSQKVGLPIATTHRIVHVLIERGYVRRNGSTRRYAPGRGVLDLAVRGRSQTGLRECALPYLRELVLLTNETANLGILEESSLVYVAQVQAPRMVRMFVDVGNRVPGHCCAAAKAVIAFQPEAAREGVLASLSLARFTPATIVDREAFRIELAKTRRRGYALDRGEFDRSVQCVAVPVLDTAGYSAAAISVSGPSARFSTRDIQGWVPRMKELAEDLSGALIANDLVG